MKAETVIAFLKAKNWKYSGENQKFTQFSPPKEIKFNEPFLLEIPKNENALTYLRYMKNITEAIAQLYEIEVRKLEILFSKTLEEIKFERKLTKGMVR